MNKISIFAAGGTGCNVAARFADYHGEEHEGIATINTFFIDTSRSNLSKNIPDDRVFLYKEAGGGALDGNGKVRSSNYDVISETSNIKQILHIFKPESLNIILHSSGGGTGSVVGPLLVKELLQRGETVVVIMVGSTTSKRDIKNTLDTLKTYENFATSLGKPINLLYRENSPETPRSAIDNEIEQVVLLLATIFSGDNHGLDSSDLRNFLNYSVVAGLAPRLTAFDLFFSRISLPPESLGIAAISLTENNEDADLGILVDYHVGGRINQKAKERIQQTPNLPLHAAVFSGFFPPRVAKLQRLLAEHEEKSKLISGKTILTGDDKPNSDGMIL